MFECVTRIEIWYFPLCVVKGNHLPGSPEFCTLKGFSGTREGTYARRFGTWMFSEWGDNDFPMDFGAIRDTKWYGLVTNGRGKGSEGQEGLTVFATP